MHWPCCIIALCWYRKSTNTMGVQLRCSSREQFDCMMIIFLAVCVVFLHCQLTTSPDGSNDEGHHVVPQSVPRHARSVQSEGDKKATSDPPIPPWLPRFCFGQPVTHSSTGMLSKISVTFLKYTVS